MQIPLPSTIKGSSVAPKQSEYLVNLILSDGVLIPRPACRLVSSTNGAPRGTFVFNGTLYSVFGQKLYSGAELTEAGDVNGMLPIDVAIGFTTAVIVGGGTNYILTLAGDLSAIADPDLPPCKSVTRVDARFIYIPVDGSPAMYSDVSDGSSIGALSFFDAEALPDKNSVNDTIRNDLFIGGTDSFERFRNKGTEDAPFIRLDGSVTDVGYVSGKIHGRDTMLFLGKDRNNGYAFYALDQGIPAIISPTVINESLNNDYSVEDLAAVVSQRFNWKGLDCYSFSLRDKTLVMNGGNWVYFDGGIQSPEKIFTWDYYHAILFSGTWYIQGLDGLYKFTDDNEDESGLFSARIKTYGRDESNQPFSISSIEVEFNQGDTNKGSVGLSLSRNAKVWSKVFYRETGGIGDHNHRVLWSSVGGLGHVDGFIGIIISCTDNIEFPAEKIVVNI